ncbi:hypothetical protein [Haloferax sp. YSMS24]|uniref:hypothetical protein n=1 Tax=Haloferax sp. YSMS24 TaxID=3388425 RepID=UPI00398CDDD3
MPPSRSRRALLGSVAGAATSLLAGCAAVPFFGTGCPSSYTLYVTPLTDGQLADFATEEPYDQYEETANELISTAANDGEATYSTYHSPPLREGIYVEHEGTYYRVEREQTAEKERSAHLVSIEYERERTPSDDATVLSLDELPEADQEAFLSAYPEKLKRGGDPHGFSIGGYEYVYPDGANSQLLDAGTVWIRYDGRPLEVTVRGTKTVEEVTYSYTLDEVAADQSAFVAFVRDEFVVTLDGLSEAEREVFEQAIEEDVNECEPLSEGFAGLKERLEAVPEEKRLDDMAWPVTYEGDTYDVSFSHAVV